MKKITLAFLASAFVANFAIACDEHKQAQYSSEKEAVQSLGSLKDGTDVSSELSKMNQQKKTKKVVKKKTKPVEVKQEETKIEEKAPEAATPAPQAEPKAEKRLEHKHPHTDEHTTAPAISSERLSRMEFSKTITELDTSHKLTLSSVALDLKNNQNLSVKINSYAFAEGAELADARRAALQRAIKIRKSLIENEIAPTRISVSTFEQSGAGADYVELNLSASNG